MKILVLSDLHLEFFEDGGRAFVDALDPALADVLVLAGDVTTGPRLAETLACVAKRFGRIVYVAGNHEYYGSSPSAVREVHWRIIDEQPNIHWLEQDSVLIDDVCFVGTTLWFPDAPGARVHRGMLNDFRAIRDFEPWVYEENRAAVGFLRETVHPSDVVVTHHLPSWRSVPPRYAASPLNAFFVCDLESLIAERQPRLWVHGHTHDSCDYRIGTARIVCNPRGYEGCEVNPAFEQLVIEV